MSILLWFKRVSEGDENAGSATFEKGEEQFGGLNMKDAIDAHVAWKGRLEQQIKGTEAETLEIGVVGSDDRCALGKWIYGEGKKMYGQMPEFSDLLNNHAQFHLKAGGVLMEAHSRGKEAAEKMLHGVEFRNASDMVQLSLIRLYAKSRGV